MNESDPSPFITKLLKWFCPEHLYEEIEGDLLESFRRDNGRLGFKRARRKYIWSALRFFRPGILLRNRYTSPTTPFLMTRHFLKIFLRATVKNGGYSIVNFSGLVLGLAVSILTLLWVLDELSYDRFHDDGDRIFRIMANHAFDESTATYGNTPGPLSEALKSMAEVEFAFHATFNGPVAFKYQTESQFEKGIYSEPEMFKVFNFPLTEGDPNKPFPDNNSIAISSTLARKYFKGDRAIGKVLTIANSFEAKVTAVFCDVPDNSSIRFDFVLPYSIYARSDPYNQEWGAWTGGITYVKLHSHSDIKRVNEKIDSHFTKPNIWTRWDDNVELFLFPLQDWWLRDNFENGKQTGGRITYVIGFSAAGLLVLTLACINFMNLSTARSLTRSREAAVRKVVGARPVSLVTQYLGESVLLSFIALIFSILIACAILPAFNDVTGKRINLDYTNPLIWGGMIGISIATGLLAGSYPAFVLSSLRVITVLKKGFSTPGNAGIRKTLVVFQFSLSITMIIGALVIDDQIEYMRTKNLGFLKENIFYFNASDHIKTNYESFRNEALQHPAIELVSQGDANPVDVFGEIVLSDDAWPGKTKEDDISFKWIQCDYDYLPSLGFTLVAGRNFSREFPSDTSNYIITEEAARQMQLSDPVGQQLASPRKGEIIGVVKDFHSTSLQSPILPAIFAMRPENANRIFIRYRTGKTEDVLNFIQSLYKKHDPGHPIEYTFLDETFDRQYRNEIVLARLSKYFTLIAIFLSGLGMFALASYSAVKRTREIGVRKVMGASPWQMILLLCKEFLFLTLIALVIGVPLGWIAMNKFLDGYAFHTRISVSIIGLTISLMIVLAVICVSFQSTRAARSNPADSLKVE